MAAAHPTPGIHAVLYALFDADERIDAAAMRRQVDLVIDAGVAGVNVLGLATEVTKLSLDERLALIAATAADVGGRVPFSVTINGPSVAEQRRQIRAAEAAGADWLVLQPPAVGTFAAAEYLAFFGRVAEGAAIPVALQNAPAYFGRGLSAEDIRALIEAHPAIRAVKGEGAAVEIAALVDRLPADVPVFNGRGGLEMIDSLRAGCAGLVLAPDLIDHAVAIEAAFRAGDEAAAERGYAGVLPAITFVMQSLESLVTYGKRLFAARAGLGPVFDRPPAVPVTAFGLDLVARHARGAGAFGRR